MGIPNSELENGGAGRTVAKGVAISGMGSIITRFLDFFIAVLLLRWLSVYEYGVYKLALASYEVFSGFFLAGLENVVVSDVSRDLTSDPRRAKAAFTVYFIFTMAVGVCFAAIFFFGGEVVAQWIGKESAAQYLIIIAVLFILAPLETSYKLRFQIFLDFGWANILRVVADGARLLLMLVLFSLGPFHTTHALATYLVPLGFFILIPLLGYRRQPLLTMPSYAEIKTALRGLFLAHGKWAIASDYINNFSQSIRPFVVRAFVGTEAVALISVAQNFIAAVKSVFPMREVLTPILPRSGDDPEKLAAQINRATKYATFGYVAVGIAAALGIPVLTHLFFPKYFPSLPFFYLLLAGLPFFGFRSVALPVFYALKQQRMLMVITASRTVAIAALNIFLTYLFGLWGAATEMVLIGVLTAPAYARAIHRILPQWQWRWKDLVTFDAYDRVVLADIRNRVLTRLKRI